MTGTGRAFMAVTMMTASVVCGIAPLAYAAGDDGVDRTVARALDLFEQGRHADALRELDSARALVRADNAALVARIDYNRACVLSAMKEDGRAQEILRGLDRSAGADRPVRGSARYNLGHLEAARAEALSTTDPEAAIASLRAAERHFRNALADLPGDADTIRNIEVVQRRRAELQRAQDQQKQDQQKQDQQKQDQEKKPDQGRKSDQPQAGEQPQDTEGQGEQSPQGERRQNEQPRQREGQQPEESNRQQQGQQQGQAESQPQSGERSDQNQPQQGSQQSDGRNEQARREGAEQQKQPGQNEPAKPLPQHADESQAGENKPELREFDVAAAQILDKERMRREQIRRMLQQMMRTRAAKVEKDW